MILNPSHDITLKGLPSEILDAYVRYKKGSRAIVSWLVQFGPSRYKGVKTLPIKELASLAKTVTKHISNLPEVIHFHFRETIAARKRLSQFFRQSIDASQDDADTVNHEHFTTSLTKIYSDLCEQCQTCNSRTQTNERLAHSAKQAKPALNHYSCLPVEDSAEVSVLIATDTDCSECKLEDGFQCPGPQSDLDIENDDMSIAIETASILERIHETFTAASTCWTKTGQGGVHCLAASAATNVAWRTLRDLETQLRDIDSDVSLSALHRRCCLFEEIPQESTGTFKGVHELLQSLAEPDQAIQHYYNCHKLTVVAHCPCCIQKPADYIQPTRAVNSDDEENLSLSFALMDNILHLMCTTKPPTIVLHDSPIFAEIGYLLTHRDDPSTSFRCTLALHLLTSTYVAHVRALLRPSAASTARIVTLKLAQQASATLSLVLADKDSFPCQCPQTIAFHLATLKDDLDAYSKHRRWDLYFQSSWIAGAHALAMLDSLSYYGMHLLHYRHYTGAVLHAYNALTHLANLAPIPALESLIQLFSPVFFPAGRPTAHFKNSWARYTGARLKFQRDRRRGGGGGGGGTHTDRTGWCMAVPAHAARGAAGLGISRDTTVTSEPKFDFGRVDPMVALKQRGWRVDAREPVRRAEHEHEHDHENPLLATLHTLNTHLDPQGASGLPTTPLAHAQIFLAAARAVAQITRAVHSADDPAERDAKMCICFVHTVLGGADRITEGRRLGGGGNKGLGSLECWRKGEREVVESVKRVLAEEMGKADEWVWEV